MSSPKKTWKGFSEKLEHKFDQMDLHISQKDSTIFVEFETILARCENLPQRIRSLLGEHSPGNELDEIARIFGTILAEIEVLGRQSKRLELLLNKLISQICSTPSPKKSPIN